VQDLVRVGVADPGDGGLVPQQTLDLLPACCQELTQPVDREVRRQRLDAEGRDGGHLVRVGHDMDREPFAGARLREREAGAVIEADAQGQWRPARPHGGRGHVVVPAKPPGPRKVDDQVQSLAVGRLSGRQVEPLAVTGDVDDASADELCGRR
jgi:hypothetical protein